MIYVLLDFENVQPEEVDALSGDCCRLMIFVGASQSKLPFEIAMSIQRLGSNASYVKISGNGSNALDFHIAFYIGQLAAIEPTACFFIVSKDTGFDPLVKHLKSKKIHASRVKSISDVSFVKPVISDMQLERFDAVLVRLQHLKTAKPRTLKTLRNTISSLFNKQIEPEEVESLQSHLVAEGYLSIVGTKLTYNFENEV